MKCHQSKKNQFQGIYVASHLIFLMFYLSLSYFLISQEKKISRIRAQFITEVLRQYKAIYFSALYRYEMWFIMFGCAHPQSDKLQRKYVKANGLRFMMLFFNFKFIKDLFFMKCLRGKISNLRFQYWNMERSLTVVAITDKISIIPRLNTVWNWISFVPWESW